eukprot:Em0001g3427a
MDRLRNPYIVHCWKRTASLKSCSKQAVKREGEALRKLTHLSKLVKSRPDGTTALGLYSGGSSSDPEPDDGENFTNGKSEIDSCATPTEDKKLNTAILVTTPSIASETHLGVGTAARSGPLHTHSWKFPVPQMATEIVTLSPPFDPVRKERDRPLSMHHSSNDVSESRTVTLPD